jgi:hypothetical protein
MRVKALLLCVALALCTFAQQQYPMKILIQLRHKVADSLSRVPRYLCTEVVDRQTLRIATNSRVPSSCPELVTAVQESKAKQKLLSSDRLRLDVALADNREIYSWVGEGRFGDQSLSQLVRIGSTSTGSFASFLHAIFAADGATFSYIGELQSNGHRVLQYGFEVPLWRSGYTIASASFSRLTAYRGTFTADAATLDLLRLEIQAESIPPELNICATSSSMDYTKLRINNVDFLLPAEADTHVISTEGRESVNRTVFSGCHQFLGESKLLLDDQPATSETASTQKARVIDLPPGTAVFTSLTEKIDPASAAAGDPIKGRLTKPIQIPNLGLTIPKGTLLNGRICQLFVQYDEWESLELGLKWESLEFEGAAHPLHLSLESAVPGTAKTADILVRQHGESDVTIGYFLFSEISKKYQIPAGFESRWTSLHPPPLSK